MRLAILITAALSVSACQALGPVQAATCEAEGLQSMVGEPASVLALIDLPSPVRYIRPGDATTRDYRLERLNFFIDADERIERITCG